jgi:hypothetical protein
MEIIIRLRREWWETLWNHVPEESRARLAVTRATEIEQIKDFAYVSVVFSDLEGATAFLKVAKEALPEAAADIEMELRQLRNSTP